MPVPNKRSLVPHIVLLALLVAGIAGSVAYRALRGRGTVRITTRPAGATIVFDGMQTMSDFSDDAEASWSRPLVLRRRPGMYDVSVAASGYPPRAAKVVVEAGQTIALDVDLEVDGDPQPEIVGGSTGPIGSVHLGAHLGHVPFHSVEAGEGRGRPPVVVDPVRPPVRPPIRAVIAPRPLIPVRPVFRPVFRPIIIP